MKVLFASIPQPRNRFVSDLKTGIEQYTSVVYDSNEFWKCENHYDVIHVHEPEYLSFEIEALQYRKEMFPKELWGKLEACLTHWSKKSKIIYTRHVQEPHVGAGIEFRKLYSLVFKHCHGIAHFANYSIEQFKALYPGLSSIKHKVIPHHNYASLPNTINKAEARRKLRIKPNAKVMLVFGSIKEHEKQLIQAAFDAIPGKNKILLAPGWKIVKPNMKWIRLREWMFNYKKWKAQFNKQYRINLGFVNDEDAQYYCNAADFLLTPRIYELNSGNITLGYTFGLVVIGKDSADIGEILKETGNPVFNPFDLESIKRAVLFALDQQGKGQGIRNQELALREWGIDLISKQYYDLYKE